MTDAEKVREGPLAVLADVLFYDPADRKRLEAALDSILTELAEAKEALKWERIAFEKAEERAEKAEAEWKQRHLDGTGKRRLERAEARIQELEAATRHLFAELDRGYGAAEAFGRLRRVLLAGSEA